MSKIKIPQIIHYCWFGKGKIPLKLEKCIATWHKVLPNYKFICWNEDNCTFDENEFVKKAYYEKKWAFVSDFYRIKALAEYGGIYLDTDVVVYRDFKPLLQETAFLSFNYDCTIGTAVIGAEPQNPFILGILEMYRKTRVFPSQKGKYIEEKDGYIISYGYNTNNYYFTYYAIKTYPEFILNNMFQKLSEFVIYPKEDFEIGRIRGTQYTIHLNDGSWREEQKSVSVIKRVIKSSISDYGRIYDLIRVLERRRRYKRANKRLPFYEYSIAQKRGTTLPEI